MNNRPRGVRLLSLWRLLFALVLGFILPLSYAIALSQLDRYMEYQTSYQLAYAFMWPKPLWSFITGLQPSDETFVFGLTFIAVCNIVLYGFLIYAVLTALQLIRHKPAIQASPPSPDLSVQP